MRKIALLFVALALVLMIASVSFAAYTQTVNGWISDSKCGAKGANAAHAACAKKCIDMGEKPVLVTDKDQKVVGIDNPDAVKGHEGQHVQVSGTMDDKGMIHVAKLSMLKDQGSGKGGAMNDMH